MAIRLMHPSPPAPPPHFLSRVLPLLRFCNRNQSLRIGTFSKSTELMALPPSVWPMKPPEGVFCLRFWKKNHKRFVTTYGRAIHYAQAYSMNDEFSRVLSQHIEYYSNDPNADRMSRIKGEMSQIRNVMIENIDKVLDRGERLELLVDKTADMQGNTFRFRKQTRRFISIRWWRNVKLTIALILMLSMVVYIAMAFVCHGLSLPSFFK